MRYISDIITESGASIGSYGLLDHENNIELEITATSPDDEPIIGFGSVSHLDLLEGKPICKGAIVKHTRVSAQFTKYIKESRTEFGTDVVENGSIDFFYLSGHTQYVPGRCKKVAGISTASRIILAYGQVALGLRGINYVGLSWFDVLVQYSKKSGENLFNCERVIFYSNQNYKSTILDLDQSNEAKRFYAKIALGVLS